jgi:predicted Zn-dependent protease
MQAADAIVIFNVTPDFPDIIILDSIKNYSTLGYYNSRGLDYIALVDARISEANYNAVVMHELGHALGLEHPDLDDHPEIGIGTLMYSMIDAGSNHITKDDLKQFCKLYHCDSSKFHGVP